MNLGRYLKVGMILGAAGYIAGVGAVVLLSDLDFVKILWLMGLVVAPLTFGIPIGIWVGQGGDIKSLLPRIRNKLGAEGGEPFWDRFTHVFDQWDGLFLMVAWTVGLLVALLLVPLIVAKWWYF